LLLGTETKFRVLLCNFDGGDDDDDDGDVNDDDNNNDRQGVFGKEALSDVCRFWDFEQK
jgi:hypothetical protein